jgi:aminocarboxymuconate-semialdehyde decarboxylase
VDVHAHVIPAAFPRCLRDPAPADWPSMAPADAPCHAHVMIAGKVYRTVSDRCWDVPKRVADMEEAGLSLQAVSPMPELLSYWMMPADAAELLRYINEQMAEMIAASGGRLVGLGAVPLQDLDLALAELHRLKHALGFAGVEIGSNVNGIPVGHPSLEPFFAEAEALDMAVFVHALRPAGMDRLVGPKNLQQVLGYPSEVGLAAASVLCSNLMLRHPRLRIAFSHGGGTLASLLPRLEQGWTVFTAMQEAIQASPSEQARRLFYDALVFDAPTLHHLIALFGDDRVMIGTDYPFAFRDSAPVRRVCEAVEDEAVRDKLLRANACAFLGLS